eukprot:1929111-Amphidinium_carterae.4
MDHDGLRSSDGERVGVLDVDFVADVGVLGDVKVLALVDYGQGWGSRGRVDDDLTLFVDEPEWDAQA